MMENDSELAACMARVALGDRQAFKRLFDTTSPRLFALALKQTRNRALAEDIVQDTFVGVWQHAASYRADRAPVMAWLSRMVRNRVIDRWRAEPPQDADSEERLAELAASDALEPLPTLSSKEEAARLNGCLEHLTAGQRQSVVLAYFHGQSHQEIARTLAAPIGTVKSWLRRALDHLKDCVGAL
ncbi:RNA polymerase sigma factor [Crenobacter cavernae]|uniref:Sigma-70 family RNA polymerase sigma factor n=1 Tax=Crenobacter cavernae TaxID=2290923 RepID=A0ABY0FBY4_9NEIS|nr:sigma-70 family RNA polymerase sigma factor [Crenobacter cavernae]RXZ42121.1 sigma-70 family RNA polymerase sigma factor [Crenobacter cavernae]